MDEQLFRLINEQWTSPALDRIMAAASSFALWWPLLAVAVVLTAWRGGPRARWMLVTLVLLLAVGETLIDNPLKHAIHRLRPWQALAGVRRVDLARPSGPHAFAVSAVFQPASVKMTDAPVTVTADDPYPGRSFPSSHVVNNFCAALVLTLFYRRRGWMFFLPATLVAYSRIYVGAHWPSDVFISMILAIGLALVGSAILQQVAMRWENAAQPLEPR